MKCNVKSKKSRICIGTTIVIILVAAIVGYSYFIKYHSSSNDKSLTDAITSFDNGKQDEGIATLESILKKDPNDLDVQTRLAQFYYQAKDYDKFLSFVTDKNLESYTIYNMMATVYQSKGENDKAEEFYKKAIEASPKSLQEYVNFAAYYQSQGKYDLALAILEQGLAVNPKSSSLLVFAASVSLKMGNKAKARDYANQVLVVSPDNSQAKAILAEAK